MYTFCAAISSSFPSPITTYVHFFPKRFIIRSKIFSLPLRKLNMYFMEDLSLIYGNLISSSSYLFQQRCKYFQSKSLRPHRISLLLLMMVLMVWMLPIRSRILTLIQINILFTQNCSILFPYLEFISCRHFRAKTVQLSVNASHFR